MSAHTGQRVVITAAAAGIGRVVVEAFVAAGAVVHLCDVNEAALADVRHSLGDSVVASRVDLADASALAAWLDSTVVALGGVDVLINNAGIKGPTALVEDVTYEEWRESLAVGLDTQFLAMKKIAPVMKAAGRGSIIKIGRAHV